MTIAKSGRYLVLPRNSSVRNPARSVCPRVVIHIFKVCDETIHMRLTMRLLLCATLLMRILVHCSHADEVT